MPFRFMINLVIDPFRMFFVEAIHEDRKEKQNEEKFLPFHINSLFLRSNG
jgi:hypothetical protein